MSNFSLSRRAFLRTSTAVGTTAALASVFGTGTARAAGEVNVIAYEGYIPKEFVAKFEADTGTKVNILLTDDQSKVFNLLVAEKENPTVDVVVVAGPRYLQFGNADLLQPLDKSRVVGWENIIPFFADAPSVKYDGTLYGMPLVNGFLTVAYNPNYADGIDSWAALWDDKYAGRIGWRITEFLRQVILTQGGDPNLVAYIGNEAEAERRVNEARDLLIAKKPLVRKFWNTPAEVQQLFLNEEIYLANAQSGHVSRGILEGLPIAYAWPKEGALGVTYSYAIARNAPNLDNAYAFLSAFASFPDIGPTLSRATGVMAAFNGTAEGLTDIERAALAVPPEAQDKLWFGNEENGEVLRRLFDRAEAEIKAA